MKDESFAPPISAGTQSVVTAEPHSEASRWGVIAAFGAIYGIWGSTYLAIRFAVTAMPPLFMASMRFLIPGVLLYAYLRIQLGAVPSRGEWRQAVIAGTLMLAIGNGVVSWAALVIPSGVVALVIAIIPIWVVLLDWLRPGGMRPAPMVIAGSILGFAGVVALGGLHSSGPLFGWELAGLIAASLSWAFGSLYCRGLPKTRLPLMSVAMQMMAGGGVLLMAAIIRGELAEVTWNRLTPLAVGSWLYLAVAGSLVAFTAYIWLLQVRPPARVATYAYVNPLIAVILGSTLGREPFSEQLAAATMMIILAVVLIVRSGNPDRRIASGSWLSSNGVASK